MDGQDPWPGRETGLEVNGQDPWPGRESGLEVNGQDPWPGRETGLEVNGQDPWLGKETGLEVVNGQDTWPGRQTGLEGDEEAGSMQAYREGVIEGDLCRDKWRRLGEGLGGNFIHSGATGHLGSDHF